MSDEDKRALSVAGGVREAVPVVAVALFAGVVNAYYGPRGFMPLDHSVVFDGGWRTLAGQVPFRDYTTPNALIPSFLQGLFFLALGVTWKAYVLHATIFNALFAVLVYVLLRLCGGRRPVSAFYAALSGLVFYPPVGVPFHDQHAFFFVLLAITMAVAARSAGARASFALWTLVPLALTAAALSKQTPALLGVPVVLALAVAPRSSKRRALAGLIAGSAAAVALVATAGIAARVDWGLVWLYFIELPLETGEARGGGAGVRPLSLLALAALLPTLVIGPSMIANRLRGRPLDLAPGVALPLALSTAFMGLCGAFIVVTLNEPAEGLPFFFASVGLFQIAVGRALSRRPPIGRFSVAAAAGALLAVTAILAGWSFNTHINERRMTSNLSFDDALVEEDLPPALSSMHFQVPEPYEGLRARDIRRVVSLLRSRPGSFVHLGDTTVLNGLTRTSSVFPALFFSLGLTVPGSDNGLADFERRLFDRIADEDVRRVVLERRAWEGGSIADLPRFRAWLHRCGGARRRIGFFEVIEIADRPTCS